MRKADYDAAWKNWMIYHLQETLAFFQPELEQAIQWETPPQFLDKAFQNELLGIPSQRKEVDLLVKVQLRGGDQRLLLLHFEFQHRKEDQFEERMYVYHCRIFGHYRQKVFSFGILGDSDPNWRPKDYGYEYFGCSTHFQFPCAKILDYQGREAELEADGSSVAIVVLAQLAAIKGQNDPEFRFKAKYRLMRMLFDKGRDKLQIRQLMGFLELVLTLEDEMDDLLYSQLKEEDVIDAVLLESYPARKARKEALEAGLMKGREEGRKEGRKEGREEERGEVRDRFCCALEEILASRFGRIPQDLVEKVKNSDLEQLHKWIVKAGTGNQIQDVFA